MTGKYMLDVFGGPGFLAKASNHMGLRGYVLDTKCGPRYDVTSLSPEFDKTSPLEMSRRNDFTSTTTHFVVLQSYFLHPAIANLLQRAGMPCEIHTLAAQPRTAWALANVCIFGSLCTKRTLFLVGNLDSRDLHRIDRKCAGEGGRCSVSGQKHVHPKASALFFT